MMETKLIFTDKKYNKELLRLALPIALQNLMLAAVAACDAIMLGRVNQDYMSAVSLAGQIQFVQNIIFWASTGATAVLGAQYFGKHDLKVMDNIFAICLRINMLDSILFWAGCVFFPEKLMMIYTSEKILIELGASYLKITGWSYLLTGLSQTYFAMMKVTDHVNSVALISSSAVIINIVVNAVLIFGLMGLPPLAVTGAALATLIARIIEVAWSMILSLKPGYARLNFKSLLSHNNIIFKDFMKCALPILVSGGLWGIGFSSYTAILGHMGSDAAAANAVSSVIRDLFCCMCNGFASGGSIMIAGALGAGNLSLGKLYGQRLAVYSIIIGLITCGLVLAVSPLVLWFYKLTPSAYQLLCQMMIILSFYMIGRCINTMVINGIFYSGGDIIFDAISLAVFMWGIAIPTAFLGAFVFHWPVWLVFTCTCLDEIGKIPVVFLHFKKYKWLKNLTREKSELERS